MISECHGHIFMNGVNYPAARSLYENGLNHECEQDIRRHLEAYRSCGVTYVRDGGDRYGACCLAKKLAPEYGIEYRIPVFAIHLKGSYGSIVGKGFETLRDYHKLVLEAGRQGADFIKVMLSGIMDFSGNGAVTGSPLSEQMIHEMIRIAHAEGFAVMAHVNGDQAIRRALEAGADSIEHGNYMTEETLQILAQSKAVWVPTHVTLHNLLGSGRFDDHLISTLKEHQISNIQRAFELGAHVAAGSDAGSYCVHHGTGILEERECIRQTIGDAADRWLDEGDRWIRNKFITSQW